MNSMNIIVVLLFLFIGCAIVLPVYQRFRLFRPVKKWILITTPVMVLLYFWAEQEAYSVAAGFVDSWRFFLFAVFRFFFSYRVRSFEGIGKSFTWAFSYFYS
jgi:hypothetical protein